MKNLKDIILEHVLNSKFSILERVENSKFSILEHFENSKFSIYERLDINKDTGNHHYNYHPTTRDELKQLVDKLIKERGNKADLNDIDTSEITDMYMLFYNSKFNGDISNCDVSNVEDMRCMFQYSSFNRDISNWDVKKS